METTHDLRDPNEPTTTYTLTCNSSASSYGQPVLVADDGTTYGRSDIVERGMSAECWVRCEFRKLLPPVSPARLTIDGDAESLLGKFCLPCTVYEPRDVWPA